MRIRGRGIKRKIVHWFARTQPGAAKSVSLLWAQAHAKLVRRRKAPWVLMELLRLLNYRVLMQASLSNGMKVVVAWNDYVGGYIFRDGYYEKDTLAVLERLLKPGMVFVDVGAHVGQYTLVASPIVGVTGQVHSFEPDPHTFSLLSRNVATNQLSNVHLNQAALFSGEGRKSLFLSTVTDIGSNSLARPVSFSGGTCEVDCVTLDTYLRARGVSQVDVMKIDVEGAEYDMLLGAEGLLTSEQGPVILIEFEEERQRAFGQSCAKLAELLQSYGYSLFRVGQGPLEEYVAKTNDAYSFNILAVPRHRCDAIMTTLLGRHPVSPTPRGGAT